MLKIHYAQNNLQFSGGCMPCLSQTSHFSVLSCPHFEAAEKSADTPVFVVISAILCELMHYQKHSSKQKT